MVFNKIPNEYSQMLVNLKLLDSAPKAVWAAVALSLAARLSGENDEGESWEGAIVILKKEWDALHQNQIVPQKPSKEWKV